MDPEWEQRFTAMQTAFELITADLCERLARVEALCAQTPTLEHGLLPPLNMVSLLELQIFHTPVLSKKDRQGRHTHWSLRLNVCINGRKVRRPVNISLYSPREFADQVLSLTGDIPETIKEFADAARDLSPDDGQCGMLTVLTRGHGTPRCRTQFAVLTGHCSNQPEVALQIGDDCAMFTAFRPGRGTKSNRAKWYGQWASSALKEHT